MKQLGFTLMLFVVVLSPLAAVCQGAPGQSPAGQPESTGPVEQKPGPMPQGGYSQPALSQDVPLTLTPPDKEWRKIQRLPQGGFIVVGNTYGPALTCRFAAATDDTLFCDAPESPGGTGWQFERASVISVEATVLKKNHHPGLIAAAITGGVLVGLMASGGMDAAHAAGAGAVGAVVTAGIGAPMALSQPDEHWVTVVYRPRVSRQSATVAHAH
jgi:hypothetical protein